MSFFVNLVGNGPSWNGDVSLRLATARAAQVASLTEESATAGPVVASDVESTSASGIDGDGAPGQIAAHASETGSPGNGVDRVLNGIGTLGMPIEDWFESSLPAEEPSSVNLVKSFELAHPVHADLAVSPELDTPWSKEGLNPGAIEPERQLSIAGVAHGTLLIRLRTAEVVVAKAAPNWHFPERSGIRVDEQLMKEIPLLQSTVPVEPQQAPMRVRFTAVLVDGALTLGAVLATTLVATLNQKDWPSIKDMGLGAVVALIIIGALFQILFLTLGKATPGMKYAHFALRTFDDRNPTRMQRCGRLGAIFLSLLPAGLGVLWALFDPDHLSLQDRMSRTYLKQY